ncbi:hypothetical protein M9H77_13993 [Catharanthus roseus]|uniref:Uncharacterized protein n=1 Tax=Catharanthus roseus TaxID=4058 RepID=A0ACC0BM33_CATRO|nr:hypothetical protein M9H77_13993 [Catharanthus roseus]
MKFFHENFGNIYFGSQDRGICLISLNLESGPEVKGLISQFINGVDRFIRQYLESNNGSKNSLRCSCSKLKNKKIIHSKVVKEYLLWWGTNSCRTCCFTLISYYGRKFTVIAD